MTTRYRKAKQTAAEVLQRFQAQEPDDSCDEEEDFQLQDSEYGLQENDQNDSSDTELEAENQQHLTLFTIANGTTQNQLDQTNVTIGTSLLNNGYLKARNGMTWETITGVKGRRKASVANVHVQYLLKDQVQHPTLTGI